VLTDEDKTWIEKLLNRKFEALEIELSTAFHNWVLPDLGDSCRDGA